MKQTKDAAPLLAQLSDGKRNRVLRALAAEIRKKASIILSWNAKDLAEMPKDDPRYDRLRLDAGRLAAIAADVEHVAELSSPLDRTLEERTLPNGLHLKRVAVPLGVIGVIYESRPNVTVDVFALCFKSGNACILKGGKEARHSNTGFAAVIQAVLAQEGINPDAFCLLPPTREATAELLAATDIIDVCIPRGSQALIDYVREHARVPVIETGAGIVHVYVDQSADLAKARDIVFNSKTRRVSVCNALDTLIIHRAHLADLPALAEPLATENVEIFADAEAFKALAGYPHLRPAKPEDFGQEFLSYKMSIKTVGSLDEALMHIRTHSSRHSEAIIAEDKLAVARFMNEVDAAAVYANASTAFTDGGQFGLGAEIGISTQKLHARGPMGLEALTSYKWLVYGNGQTRD